MFNIKPNPKLFFWVIFQTLAMKVGAKDLGKRGGWYDEGGKWVVGRRD
jgi:hypothetical protein